MLEVTDLSARYGPITALSGVTLDVQAGEAVVLIGANGAGKSTCLMSISGPLRSISGSIRFEGRELVKEKPHAVNAAGIAHVPEGRRIFKTLSVEENLRVGAYRNRARTRALVDYVYEMFPILAERRASPANSLSGGQQQMLAIGRALMSEPKLLLLDEPSLGLAPTLVAEIYEHLGVLHRAGTTLLLVEQNVGLAFTVATRGYLLERGAIVISGSAAELMESPIVQSSYLGGGVAPTR